VAAGFLHGPAEHGRAQAAAAAGLVHPDGLDLRAQRAAAGQPGDERELHGGDWVPAGQGDYQEVSGIGVDGVERPLADGQILGRVHAVAGGAELVGEQVHDAGNVAGLGPAQNHGRGAQLQGGQFVHGP
jgi:hypothetical protein